MFSIKNNLINADEVSKYEYNNCIFSNSVSRPSKSIIDCELYKNYSKINLNIDILNEFSYLNTLSQKKEYFLMREIINVFKLHQYENDNLSLSFDNIIVNEIENKNGNTNTNNLIFCFDNDNSLRNILTNISILIKELENNDNVLLNYHHLFTYPSAELLIIISILFNKIKIYYSKLLKQNILYCINYKNNSNITVFIKNILLNWNKESNIRQFGIFINNELLNKIKNHNNSIFDYYINLNNNFALSTLDEKEYFFKNYVKKHNKITSNCFDCNHTLKEYNLFNCYICSKCYDLFMVY